MVYLIFRSTLPFDVAPHSTQFQHTHPAPNMSSHGGLLRHSRFPYTLVYGSHCDIAHATPHFTSLPIFKTFSFQRPALPQLCISAFPVLHDSCFLLWRGSILSFYPRSFSISGASVVLQL